MPSPHAGTRREPLARERRVPLWCWGGTRACGLMHTSERARPCSNGRLRRAGSPFSPQMPFFWSAGCRRYQYPKLTEATSNPSRHHADPASLASVGHPGPRRIAPQSRREPSNNCPPAGSPATHIHSSFSPLATEPGTPSEQLVSSKARAFGVATLQVCLSEPPSHLPAHP
jgi:hypothetical protein